MNSGLHPQLASTAPLPAVVGSNRRSSADSAPRSPALGRRIAAAIAAGCARTEFAHLSTILNWRV